MTTHLASVVVGGDAAPWRRLGFTVVAGVIPFGNGAIELDPAATGPVALRVDGLTDAPPDVDGVALWTGARHAVVGHANGCFELDHVVIATPSIERTSAAVERALGLPRRRLRETAAVRQAFHRFDERGCIVELVERPELPAAALWGLVLNTDDLDALVAAADGLVGDAKPAVQPGRRIATAHREAALGCAVAFMTPGDQRSSSSAARPAR